MLSRDVDDGLDPGLGEVFEILEEIEFATSEIHWRTAVSGGETLANEAARLAREGEQLIARRADGGFEGLLGSLKERHERLQKILAELDDTAAATARP